MDERKHPVCTGSRHAWSGSRRNSPCWPTPEDMSWMESIFQEEDAQSRPCPPAEKPEPPEFPGSGSVCGHRDGLTGWPLAMVYTPDQIWQNLYTEEEGFRHGTLFRELDDPFYPGCTGCTDKTDRF